MHARLALLLPLALLAFGSAGAEGPATGATADASSYAVRILVPNQPATGTPIVANGVSAGSTYGYPADGSIVAAASTTATATSDVQRFAAARAESDVTGLSLFAGEITADAVTGRASAGTGYSGVGGNQSGSTVTNLKVLGQPVVAGTKVQLADWGTLSLATPTVDRNAPAGTRGYAASIVELDVKLQAAHGGLPAGSEIRIGFAAAGVQTAPPASKTLPTTTVATPPAVTAPTTDEPPLGDRPQDLPRRKAKSQHVPLTVQPKLTAGRYVFPVYGPSSYVDTFGAARSDVTYHHGDDIFGTLGQPLVAVTDGTVFSVGWNRIGGYRLWLLDKDGNQFYYAHLSAFSTFARNGAHVKAGEVIGFMGKTGDAEGTPVHLHFEVHPVSLLYLGYDGAVDPTAYLDAWSHQKDLPFPIAAGWAPNVPGIGSGPEPGAILLGMSDISSADGLDPASLTRALAPLPAASLMHTLVPTLVAPTGDLGATHGPGT